MSTYFAADVRTVLVTVDIATNESNSAIDPGCIEVMLIQPDPASCPATNVIVLFVKSIV